MKDCAGTCGLSEVDECGQCQSIHGEYRKQFKDCNGDCFGSARLDDCGQCTGGNTNRVPNSNKDVCGVCFGNGTQCLGCDNVVKSGKQTDLCGMCLHPTNPSFNSNCLKITGFTPTSSSIMGEEEIMVLGAGFNSDDISCAFFNDELGEMYNVYSVKGKYSEAVVRRCSVKKVFLIFSQNSRENDCARVSF